MERPGSKSSYFPHKCSVYLDLSFLPLSLSLSLTLPQIAQLHAELEKARGDYASSKKELSRVQQQLGRVTQQNELLVKTTVMYEADKRELESEVRESPFT